MGTTVFGVSFQDSPNDSVSGFNVINPFWNILIKTCFSLFDSPSPELFTSLIVFAFTPEMLIKKLNTAANFKL
jgi:hypothetical protein